MTTEKVESTGRFGHHPDPAVDFAVEVTIIEGMVEDCKAGLEKHPVVEDRIFKAMQFRVGGTVLAVAAKVALLEAEAKLKVHLSKESRTNDRKVSGMDLVAVCFCRRSFAKGGGPSIEPSWKEHPRCPECGRDRPVMDRAVIPVVLSSLRLVEAEEARGEMPFQMDCFLADLRVAVKALNAH
jgi:hypothetical protein